MERKTVCLPIKVPTGKYCWEYDVAGTCDYFDNEGGHSKCELHFDVKDTKKGVVKDPICASLKKVEIK